MSMMIGVCRTGILNYDGANGCLHALKPHTHTHTRATADREGDFGARNGGNTNPRALGDRLGQHAPNLVEHDRAMPALDVVQAIAADERHTGHAHAHAGHPSQYFLHHADTENHT